MESTAFSEELFPQTWHANWIGLVKSNRLSNPYPQMALSMGKQMTLPAATISSPFHSVNCCKEMKILFIKNNLVSMQHGT